MNDKAPNMQDSFLNSARKQHTPVTVFLVNGVKLQGVITSFDNFSIVLRRGSHMQLIYKHAVATVVPTVPFRLSGYEEGRHTEADAEGTESDFVVERELEDA